MYVCICISMQGFTRWMKLKFITLIELRVT